LVLVVQVELVALELQLMVQILYSAPLLPLVAVVVPI
jgi:hypothetical protein